MSLAVNNVIPDKSNFNKDVDFLIMWSGSNYTKKHSIFTDKKRHSFNNEIIFCIKGIIVNCPWYNKIIIYLDDKNDFYEIMSQKDCEENRILLIERESYFESQNYPTNNNFAIQTTIHKIKDLSEYFILICDDIIINKSIEKGQWFNDDGKPYIIYADCICGHKVYNGQNNQYPIIPHPIYVNPNVCDLKQPLTHGPYTHLPISLTKSLCIEVAELYPEWFAFVQSHKVRFNSISYKRMWGCEESLYGVWTNHLIETKQGIPHYLNKFDKRVLVEFPWCKEEDLMRDTALFVNFNDNLDNYDDNHKKNILTELMKSVTNNYNMSKEHIINKIISKLDEKFLIYKIGGSGFFHNLSGLSYAINVAKQLNRTLIIEQFINGVKRINFEEYIKIDEPELKYGFDYNVLPKDATWKGCDIEEIKSLYYDTIKGNFYYYKGKNLTVIEKSEINNQIIILCLYNPGINTNIKISDEIMQRLENEEKITEKYFSVHYRNSDMKHDIQPFLDRISFVINKFNLNTLYLASDDLESYKKIQDKFPELKIVRKSFPPEGLSQDWSLYTEDKDKQLYEFLRDVYFIFNSEIFIPSMKSSVSRGILQMINEKKYIFPDLKTNVKYIN